MQRMKNIKILIGMTYLIVLSIFLFWFFSNFNIDEITNYKFIQSNRDYFVNLKNKNLIFISLFFTLLTLAIPAFTTIIIAYTKKPALLKTLPIILIFVGIFGWMLPYTLN